MKKILVSCKYFFLLIIIFQAISAGLRIAIFESFRKMIKYSVEGCSFERLHAVAGIALIIIICFGSILIITIIVKSYVAAIIKFKLRQTLMNLIMKLKIRYFDNHHCNDIVMKAVYDVEAFTSDLIKIVSDETLTILISTSLIIYLFFIQAAVMAVIFVEMLIIVMGIYYFQKLNAKYALKVRDLLGGINKFVYESIQGIFDIQIFNKSVLRIKQFNDLQNAYKKNNLMSTKIVAIPIDEITYLIYVVTVLFIFGFKILIEKKGYYGEIFIFLLVMPYMRVMFANLLKISDQFYKAVKSYQKINSIFSEEQESDGNAVNDIQLMQSIEFKNVYFGYETDQHVLSDINIEIKQGEHIAIVGMNGSGKSTLINLIGRSYEVTKGAIYINGKNIKTISLNGLRKRIKFVSQKNTLFPLSVVENIQMGNETLERKKMDDDIYSLVDSSIIKKHDEQRSLLTAAESQLVFLLRAISHDADIYIFDEITSNLDMESEVKLKSIIDKYLRNKTCIFVSHLLHSLPQLSKIVVLNNGRVESVGTHKELYAQKGIYYNFYNLQYLESVFSKIVQIINSIAIKDGYTRFHFIKSALLARRMGEKLGLDPDIITSIELAGYLGDIGKMMIPQDLLKKPGLLTPEERKIMENHVITGSNITKKIKETTSISHIIYHHHEQWDGQGYPEGLKGEEIPLGSRIITIIDTYRAMMTGRPYREKLGQAESIRRLRMGAGSHFDPNLVNLFIEILEEENKFEEEDKRIIKGYERWYNQLLERG